MWKQNRLYTALLVALCFLLVLFQPPSPAAAYDASRDCTFRVEFRPGGSAASGIRFRLYRVADVLNTGHYALSGDFRDCGVSFAGLDSSGWTGVAKALYAYVQSNNLSPLRESVTDGGGTAAFTELQNGLYLVEGGTHVSGRHTYTPTPFLVSLPHLTKGGDWEYSVTSEAKYKDNYDPPESYASLVVVKNWKGDTASDRPGKITVELFYKGTHNRTVTLNRANNWTYTDSRIDLSRLNRDWSVEEVKVDGYVTEDASVSVSGRTVTISITNRRDKPDNPHDPHDPDDPHEPDNPHDPHEPDNPHEPHEPNNPHNPGNPSNPTQPGEPGTPDSPGTPGTPGTPGAPESPDNPGEPGSPEVPSSPNHPGTPEQPKLPQTGMLWWPVPVLYLLGVIMAATGLFLRREKKNGQKRKA